MLKTNTKQARSNIRDYILNIFDTDEFDHVDSSDFAAVKECIKSSFFSEMADDYRLKKGLIYDTFVYWSQGLPSVIDTADYYLHSAVDIVGDLLEETEEEKARFSEIQAEELLTRLIYRELF